MADTNQSSTPKSQEMKTELNRSASGEPLPDPKSIHDLTQYVYVEFFDPEVSNICSLSYEIFFKFVNIFISLTLLLDDMGHRIDDLEKNIGDLMTQAGVEETDK
ncbi:UNVERIFIED_CONTAM: Heat shock factor-binding protein 1 [Trichonephila clavipes]